MGKWQLRIPSPYPQKRHYIRRESCSHRPHYECSRPKTNHGDIPPFSRFFVPPPPTAMVACERSFTLAFLVPASPQKILPSRYSRPIHACGWRYRARRSWYTGRTYPRHWALVLKRVRKIYSKKYNSASCTHSRPLASLLPQLVFSFCFSFYLLCIAMDCPYQISRTLTFPSMFCAPLPIILHPHFQKKKKKPKPSTFFSTCVATCTNKCKSLPGGFAGGLFTS